MSLGIKNGQLLVTMETLKQWCYPFDTGSNFMVNIITHVQIWFVIQINQNSFHALQQNTVHAT
jgi:hypothetical protein